VLFAGGCRAGYVARLAWEEARFLASARPATELLATSGNPVERRALEALVEVRAFAAREGLRVGGSYRKVADTTAASPFHVVTAAHADRLQAWTWWYPVIGAIPYRGYFDRESAERFAAGLRARGLDTRIVEASAYSTLGWFDDPLPSGVLRGGEGAVVLTVLHELVHQTFFAPGQVAFNETLATAVAWRLAEKWWIERGDQARAERVRASRRAWVARSDAMDAAAVRLKAFFEDARARGLSREEMLERRRGLYDEVLAGLEEGDPEFAAGLREDGGLDNAAFLASWRYAEGGRAVDAFLASQPDVAAALARLSRAVADGEDLREVVAACAGASARLLLSRPVPRTPPSGAGSAPDFSLRREDRKRWPQRESKRS
jgi:predicted aminopeptidase